MQSDRARAHASTHTRARTHARAHTHTHTHTHTLVLCETNGTIHCWHVPEAYKVRTANFI